MENKPDFFRGIEQVEVPDFLFSRIQAKIEAKRKSEFSPKAATSISLAFLFVFMLNVVVIVKHSKQGKQEQELIQGLQLTNENALYK